jgi:hypothetical protein
MMQLFKQFGITQFDFSKVTIGFGYYTGKTGNEYFFEVKTRTNDASAFTYSTVIEKSKLEFILNETKNIKHQPLVFFL